MDEDEGDVFLRFCGWAMEACLKGLLEGLASWGEGGGVDLGGGGDMSEKRMAAGGSSHCRL